MTRRRGEIPEPEEQLLGIERPTPEQEAEFEKRRQEEAQVERIYLCSLMGNELFRKWLMRQLQAFNTFGRTFAVAPNGAPDPQATDYQLGLKAAGWHLWCAFDDIAPDLASRMRREANAP